MANSRQYNEGLQVKIKVADSDFLVRLRYLGYSISIWAHRMSSSFFVPPYGHTARKKVAFSHATILFHPRLTLGCTVKYRITMAVTRYSSAPPKSFTSNVFLRFLRSGFAQGSPIPGLSFLRFGFHDLSTKLK